MTARGSVIVIGAGIAGITAAAHLSRAGMDVTVLEKDPEPGGRCGRLVRDGHHFDLGPTLFVMRPLYEAEFRELGVSVGDRLELLPVDPTYQLVFDDGSGLALTADMTAMRDQLEAIEPGGFDGFRRYVRQGGRHYGLVVDKLVNRDFRGWSDLIALDSVRMLLGASPLLNHYRSMGAYFGSSRLKSAFTFQDLYVGLSPFQAPATLSFLPYTELAHGVWYPRGGMYRVAEALVEVAVAAGVEFRYDSTVTQIEVTGRRVRGVRLADGSRVAADVVVANADLPWVYEHLLPADETVRRLARKHFSCSTISFFWGVDGRYEALRPHTLFLADDFRENFDVITRDHGLAANPSLYVHAPARIDPLAAPSGRDTITAIVPVGHLDPRANRDWDALRDQAREQVFRRLETIGVADIRTRIIFERAYTPITWADRHNLTKGATHGLSHRLSQMASFRPSNRHPRYQNLYFAGASTHPGTGVPTAMVSGRHVAHRVTAELS